MVRKSPVVELLKSKRSYILVNRTVGGLLSFVNLSFVNLTEISMVDADGTADKADTDEADTNGDIVDLDMIAAMAKR